MLINDIKNKVGHFMSPFFGQAFNQVKSQYGLAAAIVTYLLRTDFSQVTGQPQSLSNGQVLDTTDEGMVDGSLTVYESSGGIVEIANDSLRLTGTQTNWNHAQVYTEQITFQDGLILSLKVDREVGAIDSGCAGYFVAAVPDTGGTGNWLEGFRMNNADLAATDGVSTYNVVTTMTFGTGEYVHLVSDVTNDLLFMYTGSPSNAVLGYIFPSFTLASGYFSMQNVDLSHYSEYSEIKIPETLQPSLVAFDVSDTFTDTNGTLITAHTADTGDSWELSAQYGSGTITADIQSNQLTCTGTVASISVRNALVTYDNSDFFMTCDITTPNNANLVAALIGRGELTAPYTAPTNNVELTIGCDIPEANYLRVLEVTNGVGNVRVISTGLGFTVSTQYNAQASFNGDQVFWSVGSHAVQATLSNPTTNLKHGCDLRDHTSWVAAKYDNFKIYPLTRTISV